MQIYPQSLNNNSSQQPRKSSDRAKIFGRYQSLGPKHKKHISISAIPKQDDHSQDEMAMAKSSCKGNIISDTSSFHLHKISDHYLVSKACPLQKARTKRTRRSAWAQLARERWSARICPKHFVEMLPGFQAAPSPPGIFTYIFRPSPATKNWEPTKMLIPRWFPVEC